MRKIWKAADLQPHRLKTFKISNGPQFAEKVVDIVGLYMNPPSNAVVLSVDESNMLTALRRREGESLIGLLRRLDDAIGRAFDEEIYTDEINA